MALKADDSLVLPLIENAKEALTRAYAPYSKFCVGAALGFKSGASVLGANVENASYGLTVCAERVALFAARAHGRDLTLATCLVIASKSPTPAMPCGACRQVMVELLSPETPVLCVTTQTAEVFSSTVGALLPHFFGPLSLREDANQNR